VASGVKPSDVCDVPIGWQMAQEIQLTGIKCLNCT
jgi:hypothetical protein